MTTAGTTTVTWRWVTGIAVSALTLIGGIVLSLCIYVFNVTVNSIEREQKDIATRVKGLEDRQLPAVERLVILEQSVKSVDGKVENLNVAVDKLTNQIQLDRQARPAGSR